MNVSTKLSGNTKTKKIYSFLLIFLLLSYSALPAFSRLHISNAKSSTAKKTSQKLNSTKKNKSEKQRTSEKDSDIPGVKIVSEAGIQILNDQLSVNQLLLGKHKSTREILAEQGIFPGFEAPSRENLPQNPNAPAVSNFPYNINSARKQNLFNLSGQIAPSAPQTVGLSFNGPTLSDTGAFPPDSMGAVGPSQFIVAVNGRIRSYNKTTGTADGVMNFDPDVFFASVMTPVGGSVVFNFTSDPNIRYDRLTGRWFITIIDVPCTNATCTTTAANRILIAVSDAASNNAITGSTVWTFYQFQGDTTNFSDYTSLGVDANALYVGANMFSPAGSFAGTDGWVVRKSTTLSGGPLTVTHFIGLVGSSTGAGPFSPRGVDNVDPANTGPTATGYFIGVDNATFSTLMIRRVTDPGSATPTISANISLTVPTTTFPNRVEHLGNTGGANGNLDSLDDRLYAAVLRNGRLWTAHNFRVSTAGVANTAAASRNAVRWYEIQNLTTTPTLVQSGTVFDNAATRAAAKQYWIPSITVSGQGHAALAGSSAGMPFAASAFTTGRLRGDTLGTMRDGPGSIADYVTGTGNYNPPSDPGGAGGRRWGDYSFTSLDPLDDMTIWTIQEYNNALNSYALRVAKLVAPPPASIADGPDAGGVYNVPGGMTSVNVTISGTSVNGSEWFDPGSNLGGNAVPFSHITASVSGSNVTVNSVTYNNPTSITLNLNTVGATFSSTNLVPDSLRDLTITNPDGQTVTRSAIINIIPVVAAPVRVSGRVLTTSGRGIAGANILVTNTQGGSRSVLTNAFGFFYIDNIDVGQTYVFQVSKKGYQFNPQIISVNDDISDLVFEGR